MGEVGKLKTFLRNFCRRNQPCVYLKKTRRISCNLEKENSYKAFSQKSADGKKELLNPLPPSIKQTSKKKKIIIIIKNK